MDRDRQGPDSTHPHSLRRKAEIRAGCYPCAVHTQIFPDVCGEEGKGPTTLPLYTIPLLKPLSLARALFFSFIYSVYFYGALRSPPRGCGYIYTLVGLAAAGFLLR